MIASEQLGSVSIVGTGIGGRPEFAARALAVLEQLDLTPHLITSSPGRLSCHVPSSSIQDAVRALHQAFELHVEGAAKVAQVRPPRQRAETALGVSQGDRAALSNMSIRLASEA